MRAQHPFWWLGGVALLAAMVLGIAACDDSDDKNSMDCVDITGTWTFQFGYPISLQMDMNIIYDQRPGFDCTIYILDTSKDRVSFNGVVDGNRLKASVQVGQTWNLRGTVDQSVSPMTITGFYTLGTKEGTVNAWRRGDLTPTPGPIGGTTP